jgi:hypothetical protein
MKKLIIRPPYIILCSMAILMLAHTGRLPVHAQDVDWSLSPALAQDDDGKLAIGLRWGLDVSPQPRIRPALDFPSELWYELRLNGAVLSRADASVEPVGRAMMDFGWRVSLSSQRPFDMQHPDRELQKFDFGYLFIGAQGRAEMDQPADEGIAGIAAVMNYRRMGLYSGLRPLLPNLTAGYAYIQPVFSEVFDALNEDKDPYRQLDLGAFWTFRSVYETTPGWFNNLRWMAGINYFRRFGLPGDTGDLIDESGFNYHLDLGYELSGMSRYLNYIFVRYSDGTFPIFHEDRRQWMIGITLGSR